MKTGCIGKSNTNNLPAPTDLTENPYGEKKLFFKDATQKSARTGVIRIAIELRPSWPIFEKCFHLLEKRGVLPKIWHIRNRLSRTVYGISTCVRGHINATGKSPSNGPNQQKDAQNRSAATAGH
jgi:hypothetical protein